MFCIALRKSQSLRRVTRSEAIDSDGSPKITKPSFEVNSSILSAIERQDVSSLFVKLNAMTTGVFWVDSLRRIAITPNSLNAMSGIGGCQIDSAKDGISSP